MNEYITILQSRLQGSPDASPVFMHLKKTVSFFGFLEYPNNLTQVKADGFTVTKVVYVSTVIARDQDSYVIASLDSYMEHRKKGANTMDSLKSDKNLQKFGKINIRKRKGYKTESFPLLYRKCSWCLVLGSCGTS